VEASQAIDLDQERTVGEILRLTLRVYWRFPLLFVVLAASVIAPYELTRFAVTGVTPLGSGGGDKNAGILFVFELLDYSLIGPLISALHVHAVVQIGDGETPRLGSVALRGLRVLPVVAAAEIIANILIGLGFLALIIPGVILALRFSVVAQSAAVDHEGWLPALRRSRRLTAGHYWHIAGLLLVIGVVTSATVFGGRALSSGGETSVGWILIGLGIETVLASFVALALAILYFDLRAGETQRTRESTPEYQHLRDLD
jgi:hypothetical protein